jgi:hypothetical protein
VDTFVVRLWDAAAAGHAADPLRGTALHVASGRSTPFVGAEQLLAFLATVGVRSPESMRPSGGLDANDEPSTVGRRGRETAAPRLSSPPSA